MLPREIYKGSPFSAELIIDIKPTASYNVRFNGPVSKTFDVTINGTVAQLNLSVEQLDGLSEAQHRWFLYESVNGNPTIIDSGYFWLRRSPLDEEGAEVLSYEERVLAAIEKRIEGRALTDYENYSIDGRQLQRIPFAELDRLRSKYRWEVHYIHIRKGLKNPNRRVRFI